MKLHIGILAIAVAAAMTVTGCQTTAGSARTAVACEKCKTVFVPTGSNRFGTYSTSKRMTCPDCVSAVENYVKTGELKHTCSHCGGGLVHCTTH